MTENLGLSWQPTLFDASEPDIDRRFSRLERIELDDEAWVDHAVGWVQAPDGLFQEVVEGREWGQRRRHMYDRRVLEPRLTSQWSGESNQPLVPALVETMRGLLSERYEIAFDSVGFNLYRDGKDSVAWHADHIPKEIDRPIVVLVSLGQPRRFLLRPKRGGKSRVFSLGGGDLLVTGGLTQRTWEHSVPKVAKAGPRISIAFRHGLMTSPEAGKS
ncbi:MAG: alpha-ketoglutarate-dependent dioxygenase AlkB [Actinomycetota bacterium]|nr:alpha-ketoglutarate-dependent dioxygenase AlkB [Actinomycetota bacterium]